MWSGAGGKWVFGDGSPPPKWLMREFRKALTAMGRNREVIHLFDFEGSQHAAQGVKFPFTFVIAICPTKKADEVAKILAESFERAGLIEKPRVIPSKEEPTP